MMTQRERNRVADELLCAAKMWQNYHAHGGAEEVAYAVWGDGFLPYPVDGVFNDRCDAAASMALSEAARLADTELVDAKTGALCETVAVGVGRNRLRVLKRHKRK